MRKKLLAFTLLTSCTAFTQNFTLVANSGIIPVQYSDCKFADVDNDGDLDLFTMGGSPYVTSGRLYKNDGNGHFTLHDDQTFIKKRDGGAAFGDVNGDGFVDLMISGGYPSGVEAALYLNDGAGNFNLSPNSNFIATMNGDVAMADFDNDGDKDILITGMNTGSNFVAALYLNNGIGVFTRNIQSGLEEYGMYLASVAVADLNGDGKLDIVTSGKTTVSAADIKIRIFLNQGGGVFAYHPVAAITNLLGKVNVADVDNDGDVDLLIAGNTPTTGGNPAIGFRTELYYNDGNAGFTLAEGMPFIGMGDQLSIAFGDVNNDGYPDILSMGRKYSVTVEGNNDQEAIMYLNNGALGGFTRAQDIPFTAHTSGNIKFADVDNDGDMDVLVTGIGGSNMAVAKLYINNLILGIEDFKATALVVYPNPVLHEARIEMKNQTIALVEVYTYNGALVLSEKTNAVTVSVDCSSLSGGIYFLSATTSEGNKIWKKIIKQ